MADHPNARRAYDAWRSSPTAVNRERLRTAIIADGGKIEGHGVIGWCRVYIGPPSLAHGFYAPLNLCVDKGDEPA